MDQTAREHSLESAATEFQRRFHISADDSDTPRRENGSSQSQVMDKNFFVFYFVFFGVNVQACGMRVIKGSLFVGVN